MKILLVDEDQSSGTLLTEAFTTNNYVVNLVTDGETALKIARSCPYDLIVLNLFSKSLKLCQLLRLGGYAGSIMMMSQLSEPAAPDECAQSFRLGANDCMTYPYDISEVLDRIYQLLYSPASL
ncbi:MAG: response regulator transcription factor [Acaryochloridaceae cyanobacterium RL_2_7]|nr:response regulator transcription factor [Acaryochloridaceae cyanobacterium RL_2_7]